MTWETLLGRVFETANGTPMRLVGYNLSAGTVHLKPVFLNTIAEIPAECIPLSMFTAALDVGALIEANW